MVLSTGSLLGSVPASSNFISFQLAARKKYAGGYFGSCCHTRIGQSDIVRQY